MKKFLIILCSILFLFLACDKEKVGENKQSGTRASANASGSDDEGAISASGNSSSVSEALSEKSEVENSKKRYESLQKNMDFISAKTNFLEAGSLLFFDLNIGDNLETVKKKLSNFGINSFFSDTSVLPEGMSAKEFFCYMPAVKVYEDLYEAKGEWNAIVEDYDFLLVFHNDKLIRFVKYNTSHEPFQVFLQENAPDFSVSESVFVDEPKVSETHNASYVYNPNGFVRVVCELNGLMYEWERYIWEAAGQTITITDKTYGHYFEAADEKVRMFLANGNIYLYDLNLFDDLATVRRKIPDDLRKSESEYRWPLGQKLSDLNLRDFSYGAIVCSDEGIALVENRIATSSLAYVFLQAFKKRSAAAWLPDKLISDGPSDLYNAFRFSHYDFKLKADVARETISLIISDIYCVPKDTTGW